ncbi:MAG: hypothetical protein ACK5CE_15105, partial [Actinomycetes bacterium]
MSSPPTASVAADTTSAEPARGRAGEDVDWTSCDEATERPAEETAEQAAGLDCGTVQVPLDHEAPERGRIDIAIARLPAQTADRDGGIVLTPGGPGYAGVDFLVGEGAELG